MVLVHEDRILNGDLVIVDHKGCLSKNERKEVADAVANLQKIIKGDLKLDHVAVVALPEGANLRVVRPVAEAGGASPSPELVAVPGIGTPLERREDGTFVTPEWVNVAGAPKPVWPGKGAGTFVGADFTVEKNDKPKTLDLYIAFDKKPGPEGCTFIEVENAMGTGKGPDLTGADWEDDPFGRGGARLGPFKVLVE